VENLELEDERRGKRRIRVSNLDWDFWDATLLLFLASSIFGQLSRSGLFPPCEASSLSLLFLVNGKEKILYL
jgi:hypothetical protein